MSKKQRSRSAIIQYTAATCACAFFLFAGAGAAYQWSINRQEQRLVVRPGRLVDVGGYRMYLNCVGEGDPTVVLDSGTGDSSLAWYKVQPEIAQSTRVCSYDRAGLGYSDAGPNRRTSDNFARELHTLLYNAGISGPYVLVGHSTGGFTIRVYTRLYPREVAGMVLVDSSYPEQKKYFPSSLLRANNRYIRYRLPLVEYLMPFGIPRLLHWCGDGPQELQPMLRFTDCQAKKWQEQIAESRAFDESAAQAERSGTLSTIPLIVLSHDTRGEDGHPGTFDLAWGQMQQELAQLSVRGSLVIANGSGHSIQIDRPDLVIKAVQRVVQLCRAP